MWAFWVRVPTEGGGFRRLYSRPLSLTDARRAQARYALAGYEVSRIAEVLA